MAERKKRREARLPEEDARKLLHAVEFPLGQNMALLRPGNWRASEWAMTVGSWRQAAEALRKQLNE